MKLHLRRVIKIAMLTWFMPLVGTDAAEIKNLDELKQIQAKVLNVVDKVQPATVALTSGKTGAWGSGVVISKEGTILTAAHVVEGADKVVVIFPNGDETEAKVLGSNRTKDTAMLQILKKGVYPFSEIGDSDKLEIGDLLIAMGHSGGHDPLRKPPVRFGRMVSRNVSGFFSSDCTLIGGDSGGPIFDINGRVVGINSSIGEDLKANNHAGISALKADWKRLENGEVWGHLANNPFADNDSPVLGVRIAGQTHRGVLLADVEPDSPALKAGIRRGDVVTSVNGVSVETGGDLLVELNFQRPGKRVNLEIVRGDEILKFEVELTSRGKLYKQ